MSKKTNSLPPGSFNLTREKKRVNGQTICTCASVLLNSLMGSSPTPHLLPFESIRGIQKANIFESRVFSDVFS